MLLKRTKKLGAVYGRALSRDWRRSGALVLLAVSLAMPLSASAAPGDGAIVDAREALRKKDRKGLSVARAAAMASNHPLAQWADYFELSNRLPEAQQSELDAFYARWPATYVEDRLRNDWLLELGKRRDWANFAVEYPRFRMNDDREVRCYALLLDHQAGKDVKVIVVGRKARDQLKRFYGDRYVAVYEAGLPTLGSAQPVADKILELFEAGEIDVVSLVYSRFKSVVSQTPVIRQLIPAQVDEGAPKVDLKGAGYEYEPDEETILATLLPRNVTVQVLAAMLENQAGFFAAQMTAMDNATRNAGDMINSLNIIKNRTRQAQITKELIEIISGAEAL